MSFPRAFIPTINEVSGFTRQKLGMATLANNTFNPYDTLTIQLQDGIADLSTFNISGYVSGLDPNNSNATPAQWVTLPSIERLIDQMSMNIGGTEVCRIDNFNHIFHTNSTFKSNDRFNIRAILNQEPGSKECSTAGDTCQPTIATFSNQNKTNAKNQTNVGFVINQWLGFLDSVKILYTNRLPPVRISLRFASANVVSASASTFAPNYQLTQVSGYCDYLTVSPELNQLINDRLSQGPIPLVFNNYQSQITGSVNTLLGSQRISTNASCIEGVWYTYLTNAYNTTVTVQDADTYHSGFFTHGTTELGNATGSGNNGVVTSHFSINGVNIPQAPSDFSKGQVFHDTLMLFNEDKDCTSEVHPNLNSIKKFGSKFFAHGRSLTYYDSDYQNRIMGIDSSGNSCEIYVNTRGPSTASQYNMLIVLQLKSVLEMGAGRSVRLIF
ncbi:MAG: hypothetical protein EOP45_08685 [Sphingobacteriaceae bacterium]|nr:MAG: hypothetical protein EOP45_08685 [Sphingobacteriaceae bacterium]